LSYLLAAVESLAPHVELTLIGREAAKGCKPLEAALRQYHWIPTLSHHCILEQMRQHDVLVLPSLFEGFGLVLVEALSQGLPIIATSHTGAPDIIEQGREGFIVPVCDELAIREAMETCLNEPERLRSMGQAALQRSLELRWDVYRMRLVSFVASMHCGEGAEMT
jgi:glycosyltransferase involved in cell wall biosynthesis